jgi:uncharacterized cupredoxin-like copper-binding protein
VCRALLLPTAVLLAALPACSGGDDDTGGGAPTAEEGTLTFEATEMAFDPEAVTTSAGRVTFVLRNEGSILHDLVIKDVVFLEAKPGSSEEAEVELPAGTYELYCSIPGHRNAGMEATLEVEG